MPILGWIKSKSGKEPDLAFGPRIGQHWSMRRNFLQNEGEIGDIRIIKKSCK